MSIGGDVGIGCKSPVDVESSVRRRCEGGDCTSSATAENKLRVKKCTHTS